MPTIDKIDRALKRASKPAERAPASGNSEVGREPDPKALVIDPGLASVVAGWPTLPEATRRRILALAKTGK